MNFGRFLVGSTWLVVLGFCLCSAIQAAEEEKLPDVVEFNRDIRPILSENCFFCHGPDKNKRQAGLRLDTEQGLFLSPGDPAEVGVVIPGKPAESELLHRIVSNDPSQVMPPNETDKRLTPREVALLTKWISQGAKYEGHWAFLSIRRPAVPQSPRAQNHPTSPTTGQNPIDAFIRDSLAQTTMDPGPEADRITLIRRLSFDLIGLPPTPEQVSSFVNDKASDAYERLVEQLLDSPHFGERFAIWWLDLVRYADTVGYHGDQDVSVSPFRQYVIESFNQNKPFDQFTVEQLAGDLLPNPTREQKIASGYNRLGMMSAEGGVQDKEYLAKYIAERVRNVSGTWMGVTLGCAECHDHKYDPFTTVDFYRMEAFFADIEERGLYSGANVDGSWGRNIKVPNEVQEVALAKLDAEIAAAKSIINTPTPQLIAEQVEWEKTQPVWHTIAPESVTSANGATLTRKDDDSILASGTSPDRDTYTVVFKNIPADANVIRLETIPDASLPAKGSGRAPNGNFVLTEITAAIPAPEGNSGNIGFRTAVASHEQTSVAEGNPYGKWAVSAAIDHDEKGKNWGWAVVEKASQPQNALFELNAPISLQDNQNLVLTLDQNADQAKHTLGHFRISFAKSAESIRIDQVLPANVNATLQVPADKRTPQQLDEIAAHYRSVAPSLESTRQVLGQLEKQRQELNAKIPSTLVTASVQPRMVRVLKRGNWMDESGEAVTPAIPALFLTSAPGETRLTRLELAKWLTAADNPLTARAFVNRVWKLMFGAGLSRRIDDLGAQGDPPSHPLLLDYLAGRFIDSGWNVKQLIELIVTSETYRQTSVSSRELRETDPYNRWLARQGRFRLDAEFVRDNALAVSGLLVSKLGGVSVKPYQPPGYWAYLNFPMREWQNGQGDDLYRRGVYTHWQRQYLHPSLLAFDAPSREECTADRARSNTPLQSLVLLNDPTYVEAARGFAEMIIRSGGSTVEERLKFAFRRAVSREIRPAEFDVLERLLQHHLQEFKADPTAAAESLSVGAKPVPDDLDKAELAAWTSVARTILNLHETITRN